jgi:lysyl-tRNA synthetase class 2
MDDTNSLIEQRKAKLAALRAKGIDPFKNKFPPGETCRHAREHYAEGREVALAGRITAHRDMGKSMFLDIRDQSGRMQIYAQKNLLGDEQFAIFQHLDLADFIGVKGTQFTTKTKEISVKITGFTILAKALRPPPAKWHGLEDTEIRYRQRYLDLMASKAAAPGTSTTGFEKGSPGDVLLLRSEIIREIRNFLHARGYVEVETPMMQAIPGGAAAQPFVTKHNALGCNFYLRIALELYLKRLLVGGVDKVFELGRNFRNEGLSRKHNPEFTMLEAYEAYGDYESMMELVESLIVHIAATVFPEKKMKFQCARHSETQTAFLQALVYCWTNLGKFIETAKPQPSELTAAKSLLGELFELRAKYGVTRQEKPHWEVASLALDEFLPRFERTKEILKNWSDPEHPTGLNSWVPQVEMHIAAIEKLKKEEIIDLSRTWQRAKYKDLVRETVRERTSGIVPDWFALSPEKRRFAAVEYLKLGGDIGTNYEDFEVTGAVFEKLIEPTLIQPTFVTHLPKELVPLAKLSPDDPTTVEVFECCINGQEIAPAYTEQNDPIAQRERLEHQAGGEQQKLDEDFLVALEHGMPPAGGMGMGIDRLCMMLLGQESIRDVILFPQLKPIKDNSAIGSADPLERRLDLDL